MNMFDVEAGRPIVARYVISELLDDHLDHISFRCIVQCTVVPATAGPLGERPPALAGHFCNVPTTLPC